MQIRSVVIGEQVEEDFGADGPCFAVDTALCRAAFDLREEKNPMARRLGTRDRQKVKKTALAVWQESDAERGC